MSTPVEQLEFLSRSKHRIRLLRALTEPCDRSSLREQTGTSKSTLSRTLVEFEDRGWLLREGDQYGLTELGELVVEGLNTVLSSIETSEKLRPIGEWLPDSDLGFDLERLRDATVYTASPNDSLGAFRRLGSELYSGASVRELTGTVVLGGIEVHRRAISDHGQILQVILTTEALRLIESDPQMRMAATETQTDGAVSIFRYDGAVPHFLALTEVCTLIGVLDGMGLIRALIRTEDPVVRAWGDETWNDYREASTEVTSLGR